MQTPVARRTMTAAEFEAYAALPENRERRLELISGDVVESFADFYSSVVGAAAGAAIGMYVHQHVLGRVTGANGGYAVGNDHLMPTVAYCSGPRPLNAREILWNPVAPDLVVIVRSSGDRERWIQAKRRSFVRAGTIVWMVNPDRLEIEVCEPRKQPVTVAPGDTLSGGDVLPGFTLAVADIFPE